MVHHLAERILLLLLLQDQGLWLGEIFLRRHRHKMAYLFYVPSAYPFPFRGPHIIVSVRIS